MASSGTGLRVCKRVDLSSKLPWSEVTSSVVSPSARDETGEKAVELFNKRDGLSEHPAVSGSV